MHIPKGREGSLWKTKVWGSESLKLFLSEYLELFFDNETKKCIIIITMTESDPTLQFSN